MWLVSPSSRKGSGHGGGLWGGASDLFPIRTSRWGCRGGQDACVAHHGVIRVHCKLGGGGQAYKESSEVKLHS